MPSKQPPKKTAAKRPARKSAAKAPVPAVHSVPAGSIACARCGEPFKPRQSNQRFHSEECRKAAGKARVAGKPEQLADILEMPDRSEQGDEDAGRYVPGVGSSTPMYDATLVDLKASDRHETRQGKYALNLALRIDNSAGVTGIPPMLKALEELMDEVLKDVQHSDTDLVDEIQARARRLLEGA